MVDREADFIRYADECGAGRSGRSAPMGCSVPSCAARPGRCSNHQYYLSALLVLRKCRDALGQKVSPDDIAALRRLADRVQEGLCKPSVFEL